MAQPGWELSNRSRASGQLPGSSCRLGRPGLPDAGWLYPVSAVPLRGPADDGVFTTVRMTYPSKYHDRWDVVAAAVTRSMKPAQGG